MSLDFPVPTSGLPITANSSIGILLLPQPFQLRLHFFPGYDIFSVAISFMYHALSVRLGFHYESQFLFTPPPPTQVYRSTSRSPFLQEYLSCNRMHRVLLSLHKWAWVFSPIKLGDWTRDDPFSSDSLMIL